MFLKIIKYKKLYTPLKMVKPNKIEYFIRFHKYKIVYTILIAVPV